MKLNETQIKLLAYLIILIVLVPIILLSGCGAKVEQATARDTLFSVEQSKAGTYGLFLTHDESVAYCTGNDKLANKAKNILYEHNGEVIITFKSKKFLTDTEGKLLGEDDCQKYCNGDSCFVTMVLLSIDPVSNR